jgi:hypothetical protein
MENKRRGRTWPLRREAKDQQVLSFLLSSLTKEVKIQVSTCETTAVI